tara:strand:+ start:2176 stop:3498 length:1323 start_codon:yes stop_codon:yes gene_type:complete
MSAHASPNIITDGLVFGYDTGYNINGRNLGVGRHFKGPISNNLLEVHNHSRSNTSSTNGFVLNGEETVNIPKIGKRSVKYVEYYNNYNNSGDLGCCPNLFYYHSGYITGVESSTSYTYSIIYKHTGNYTHPNFMYRYEYQTDGTYNTEGGIHSTASSRRRHLGNGWYHAWGTFTTQSTTTQLRCYSFLYNYGTTKHRFYVASISLIKNISGSTHLITPPQLMLNPNTSISSTQSLIDLTRTTNIDVSNVSFDSNAQMTFDGTDDYSVIPYASTDLDGDAIFSVEAVIKRTGTMSNGGIWGIGEGTQAGINGYVFASSPNKISIDLWGTATFHTGVDYPLNKHVHVTWVKTTTGFSTSTIVIYVNGVAYTGSDLTVMRGTSHTPNLNTSTTGKGIVIGRVGATTNSYYAQGEVPILKVYNKVLTTAEVRQNFNATKDRFGL